MGAVNVKDLSDFQSARQAVPEPVRQAPAGKDVADPIAQVRLSAALLLRHSFHAAGPRPTPSRQAAVDRVLAAGLRSGPTSPVGTRSSSGRPPWATRSRRRFSGKALPSPEKRERGRGDGQRSMHPNRPAYPSFGPSDATANRVAMRRMFGPYSSGGSHAGPEAIVFVVNMNFANLASARAKVLGHGPGR